MKIRMGCRYTVKLDDGSLFTGEFTAFDHGKCFFTKNGLSRVVGSDKVISHECDPPCTE